ncbi:MAG: hypothetical protein KKC84_03340, partial [Candidatus Omnitrophica bacterium]|nr:hypothetical protein [Candidatus Omnitrophota bacterium]
ERLQTEEVLATEKINQLNSLTAQLSKEKDQLQEQLIVVQGKESVITEELLRLDKHLAILEKTNFEKMYQWVKIHQNPRTGLVMSFEGDTSLKQWAFMYDQALLIQAYTHFADYRRARKLLDFFAKKAERMEGLWVNAYYANDGLPAEYVVHSGPNIWLGLSIAQYTHKTQDTQYLGLAEEIARKIMDLQDEDPDGGIRGGPQVSWYATEHNLDAYAFFTMLYTLTQKELYAQRSQKVLQWLMQHTYDRQDLPIRRGKGDATIATDTYSWSIAAIGPETLERIEMNPDRILEFAESNCSVEVDFKRPEGESVRIKGFDFAPAQHVGRGGVVSSEWTAQMVMAFKIMSDYSHQKGLIARARAYALKADEYLMNLNKMIISSPSPSGQGEGCLPYATHDFVDTGHGWRTPKGTTTGSVAGTVYALFAYYNYNPLRLNN